MQYDHGSQNSHHSSAHHSPQRSYQSSQQMMHSQQQMQMHPQQQMMMEYQSDYAPAMQQTMASPGGSTRASAPVDHQVKEIQSIQKKIQKDVSDLKKQSTAGKKDPALKALVDKHAKAMSAIEKSIKTLQEGQKKIKEELAQKRPERIAGHHSSQFVECDRLRKSSPEKS